MTEDTHHIKVGFEPRKPQRHRFFDVLAILFACALIATVFQSSVLFAVLSAVFVLLYVVSPRSRAPEAR